MLEIVFVVVGSVLATVILVDFLATALSVVHTRGTIARLVSSLAFRATRVGPGWWRALGGPVGILAIIATWFGGSIVAWAMVVGPVIGSGSLAAAFRDGALLLAVGPGSVADPGEPVAWIQLVAHLYGLALLTLSLAWVLPVISGVVARRSFATYVAMFTRPLARVGGESQDLHLFLHNLTGQLVTVAEQHRAYPVLHGFGSRTVGRSFPAALLRLHRVLQREDVDPLTRAAAHEALRHMLGTLLRVRSELTSGADDLEDDRLVAILSDLVEQEGHDVAEVTGEHAPTILPEDEDRR